MYITVIKTQDATRKFPVSTTEDPKVFEYENVRVTSMYTAVSIISQNYILNFPFDESIKTFTARRTKEFLGDKLAKTSNYMILDFDGVQSIEERENIMREFVAFKSVFFTSRSCNDITNFNFKGIIAVEDFSRLDMKRAINAINHKLTRNGIQTVADVSSVRTLQITAPSNKLRILRCDEVGAALTRKDLKDHKVSKTIRGYKPEIRSKVFELFEELGFIPTSPNHLDKVNFEHTSGRNGYVWYENSPFTLWHWNPTRNVDIGMTFRQRFKITDYILNQSLQELLAPTTNNNNVIPYVFETNTLDSNILSKSLKDWRDSGGVFCLKSAMGTGKTTIIERVLKMFKNVLVVTPRVSLAVELSKRLDIGIYTDSNYQNLDQLCVQYDSLFKMELHKFQCVIFDEFMTLESHVINNTSGRFNLNNVAKLHSLLSNKSVNVMIMDALLADNVIDLFHDRDVYWNVNTYLDKTPLIIHKTFESFLKELSSTLLRRITVSCVSRDMMQGMKEFLEGHGHTVCTVSSNNSPAERKQILEDFKNFQFSALVYTPSISVGINIDSTVDRHFHYDPGGVVTPVQSIQMMKRARLPFQIDCFIGSKKEYNCLSIDEIRNQLVQSNSPTAFCNFNKFGDVTLSPSGKLYSWLMLHDNIWRSDPVESFAHLAMCNFRVMLDCQVLGADEFKGVNLKTYKAPNEGWTPEIREYLMNTIGDYMHICEDWITPEEVKTYVSFNEFKRSYNNTVWRANAIARATLRGDFTFKMNLYKFSEVQEILERDGKLNEKQSKNYTPQQLKEFGLEKVKTLLGYKYVVREDFANLYDDIWKDG